MIAAHRILDSAPAADEVRNSGSSPMQRGGPRFIPRFWHSINHRGTESNAWMDAPTNRRSNGWMPTSDIRGAPRDIGWLSLVAGDRLQDLILAGRPDGTTLAPGPTPAAYRGPPAPCRQGNSAPRSPTHPKPQNGPVPRPRVGESSRTLSAALSEKVSHGWGLRVKPAECQGAAATASGFPPTPRSVGLPSPREGCSARPA